MNDAILHNPLLNIGQPTTTPTGVPSGSVTSPKSGKTYTETELRFMALIDKVNADTERLRGNMAENERIARGALNKRHGEAVRSLALARECQHQGQIEMLDEYVRLLTDAQQALLLRRYSVHPDFTADQIVDGVLQFVLDNWRRAEKSTRKN